MGAWHLMRGWADTGTVIARCSAAQAGGEIGTQSLGGVKEPWEWVGDIPGDTAVARGGQASPCFVPGWRWQLGKEKHSLLNYTPHQWNRYLVTE